MIDFFIEYLIPGPGSGDVFMGRDCQAIPSVNRPAGPGIVPAAVAAMALNILLPGAKEKAEQ